jgi:indole-3-glycerol phosphate synthase
VLLMVSVLGAEVADYLARTRAFGMQALVEVRDHCELEMAMAAGARLVAVNARDLDTLAIDMDRSSRVVRAAHVAGLVTVAASGVRTRADVEAAAEVGADAVLVGEMLMRATRPEEALGTLMGVAKYRNG